MAQIFLFVFFICVIGIIITLVWTFFQSPTVGKVRDIKISKRKFVLLSLQWCTDNLGTIRQSYQLKLHYYKHRKYGGWYVFDSKMIRIYVYDDLSLIDLVDAVIHEYTHHLQFEKKNSKQDFHKLLNEVGYWDNPYEVEARKIAYQNKKACLKWIFLNFDPC